MAIISEALPDWIASSAEKIIIAGLTAVAAGLGYQLGVYLFNRARGIK